MDTKRNVPRSWMVATVAIASMALSAPAFAVPATAALVKTTPAGSGSGQLVHTPIKHVVVIYMENHSFDNVLGYWCDQHSRCPDGGMPSSVRLSNGAVVTPTVDPDTVPKVNHDVAAQLAAMNIVRGVPQMNGWQNLPAKPGVPGTCSAATHYQCISGYKPAQIPNITKLANHFAISDDTFSMGASPSWGGHLYSAAASLDGFTGDNPSHRSGPGWGCDSHGVTPWHRPGRQRYQLVPSCVPDPSLSLPNGGAFEPTPVHYVPTIFDRLDAAGLSWKIYGSGASTAKFSGYNWSICPTFAECLDTGQRANRVDASTFPADAARGKLPAYSIVAGGGAHHLLLDSCHNTMSMTACDNYIGSLVSDVEQSPEWSSTAIFVTFDDIGGFYDQVPPPVNPDGTQEGPRVPMIIVSPYARSGFTDRSHATFASILAYTEHNFGLSPLGQNDAGAYDFSNAFNYSQPPLTGASMVTRPLPPSAKKIKLTPALLNDPS